MTVNESAEGYPVRLLLVWLRGVLKVIVVKVRGLILIIVAKERNVLADCGC